MQKTLTIGKTKNGNKVEVTIKLEEKETVFPHKNTKLQELHSGMVLSITGGIWNKRKTDYTTCGQIYETLETMYKNKELELFIGRNTFLWVLEIWNAYRLNDLSAGTDKQTAVLATAKYPGNTDYYTWAVGVLDKAKLTKDRGYGYGSAWLFQEIPVEVIKRISEFIES